MKGAKRVKPSKATLKRAQKAVNDAISAAMNEPVTMSWDCICSCSCSHCKKGCF